MSFCKKEGKDQIIFVTKEDHEAPIKIDFEDDEDDQPGIILPNGEINWNCPCLGGMATGPCGVEFREAFSCFQYSKATPKGSDCFDQFHGMQACMSQYPTLYPQADSLDIDEDEDGEDASGRKGRESPKSAQQVDEKNPDQTSSSTEHKDSSSNQKPESSKKSKWLWRKFTARNKRSEKADGSEYPAAVCQELV